MDGRALEMIASGLRARAYAQLFGQVFRPKNGPIKEELARTFIGFISSMDRFGKHQSN